MRTQETERLILRPFDEDDMDALYLLLKDVEVNTFLPWFPAKSREEAVSFYEQRILPEYKKDRAYYYAICLKDDRIPVGYIKAETDESHDFGYALRREFWGRGIVTEAGRALLQLLKEEGVPYITATHDVKNPRSGAVMRRLGMEYKYSYQEQWQPKDFLVTFRMYQLNFDGNRDRVYKKYWELYERHYIETEIED